MGSIFGEIRFRCPFCLTAKLLDECRKAAHADELDCIYLGAMSLGGLMVAEEATEELGIPVFDPLRIGLTLAALTSGL